MAIAPFSKFNEFKNKIQLLPVGYDDQEIISDKFLLDRDEEKKLEIYYAPFEHINEHAKIVIVGITPGLHQMKKSFSTVLNPFNKNLSDENLLHEVKKNSSFEGTMRKNLIQMLDDLDLHTYFGLSSTSELFSTASDLVHTTSVITYPVFYNGKNYSGSTPKILKLELLKQYVLEGFAREIVSMENPLVIPLGVNVSTVLEYLAQNGSLKGESILHGFPHPSGGNGHRHKQFAQNKDQMRNKITEFFSV